MTTMSWVNNVPCVNKDLYGFKFKACANPLLLVMPEKARRPLLQIHYSQIKSGHRVDFVQCVLYDGNLVRFLSKMLENCK